MQNCRGIEIDRTGHSYILSDDAFTELLMKEKSKVDNGTTQTYPSGCIGHLNDGSEIDSRASCGAKKNDLQYVTKRIQLESERSVSNERLKAETSTENRISDGFSGSASFKNCQSGFLSNESGESQNQNQSAATESSSGLGQARPWNFCRQLHSELCMLRQELEKEREIRSKLERRIAKQNRRIRHLKCRYSSHRKLPPIVIRLETLESGKFISDINASYEFNAVVKQAPRPAFSNKLKTQSCGEASPVDEDVSDCRKTHGGEKLRQEQLQNGIGEIQQNGLDEHSNDDGSCKETSSSVDFDKTEDGFGIDIQNEHPLDATAACNLIYVSNINPLDVKLDASAGIVESSTESNGLEEYKINSDCENEYFSKKDCLDCGSDYRRGKERSDLANKSSEKKAQESDTKKQFPGMKMGGLEESEIEEDLDATGSNGEVTDCFVKGILREALPAKKHSLGYLYGCNLCGLKFAGTEALQCHKPCTLSVTGKDPFVCSGCRTTFSACEELEQHVDITHRRSCSETHPVYDKISRAKNAPVRFSVDLSETDENELADSENQLRFQSRKDKICNAFEHEICQKIMVSKNSPEQHMNHHKHNAIEPSSINDVSFTQVPLTSSPEWESSTPSQDLNCVKKCTKDKQMFKKKSGNTNLKENSPAPVTDRGKIGDLKDDDSQGIVSDGNGDELCIPSSEEAYIDQPCPERCLETFADLRAVDMESSCKEIPFDKAVDRTPVRSAVGGSDCCVDNVSEFSEFADIEGEDDDRPVEKEKVRINKFRPSMKIDTKNGCSESGIAKHHRLDSKKLNESGHERCLYGCSVCRRAFSTMISLRRHQCPQNGGSNKNVFFCGECQDGFNDGRELERHIASIHSDILFSCAVCKKTYGQEKLYRRHMRKHLSEGPYVCDNCRKEFNSRHDLSCHAPCTVDKGIQCKYCTMTFDKTSKLRSHVQVEHSKSAVACNLCGKKLSSKKSLDVHVRKHARDSEKPHCCAHCSKRFSSKGTLNRHLYSVLNGPFSCFVCNKVMNSKSLYDAHMRRHASQTAREDKESPENEGAEFRCTGCGKSFGSQKELDVHSKVHVVAGNSYFCKLCRTKFCSLELLREHLCQTFSVRKEQFKCPECEEVFQSAAPLKKHLGKVHLISDAFKCKECGKQFEKFGLWNRHFQLHHTEKRYVCDRCGKSYKFLHHLKNRHMPCFVGPGTRLTCHKCGTEFAKASQLRTHLSTCRNARTLQCNLCPRSFQSKYALNRHIYRHSGEKPYHCAQCNKCFSFREGLLTHMKRHLIVKTFVCDVCSKTFATDSFLRSHVKKVHVSERPFKCRECGTAFVYECFLRYHTAKVHRGQRKRFHCGVCSKSFCSKMYLKMHMCSHTGQVPYLCSYCGKGFRAPILLKYHLRMHTGEKPYACRYCFRRFSMPRSMRNHERLHTGEKPYQCIDCGMKFPLSSYLKAHQLKAHAIK